MCNKLMFKYPTRPLYVACEIWMSENWRQSEICVVIKDKSHGSDVMGYVHTYTCLTALFPRLSRCAGTRKVEPIWILLEQQTVSGSGISWAICKSTRRCIQITTPTPHHSVFLQTGCPSCCQTKASKHRRYISCISYHCKCIIHPVHLRHLSSKMRNSPNQWKKTCV